MTDSEHREGTPMTPAEQAAAAGRKERLAREARRQGLIGGEPEPRRRYTSIYLGRLRTSDSPADSDLYLESGNGTTIVCFAPGDLRALRALLMAQDDLAALEARAAVLIRDFFDDVEPDIAEWEQRNAQLVHTAHADGYRQGVQDMENTPACRTAPVTADEVIGFLTGLAGTPAAIQGGKLDALGTVVEFLGQMKARSGDEADRG
jgi:hypothetical protein